VNPEIAGADEFAIQVGQPIAQIGRAAKGHQQAVRARVEADMSAGGPP
jgi:hypothetical protein